MFLVFHWSSLWVNPMLDLLCFTFTISPKPFKCLMKKINLRCLCLGCLGFWQFYCEALICNPRVNVLAVTHIPQQLLPIKDISLRGQIVPLKEVPSGCSCQGSGCSGKPKLVITSPDQPHLWPPCTCLCPFTQQLHFSSCLSRACPRLPWFRDWFW